MHTLFVALNSRYSHSNLAVYKLAAKVENSSVLELNINQDPIWMLEEILNCKPDIVSFSCYIWNIEWALKLAEDLSILYPNMPIVLGGPEVSFSTQQLLLSYPFIDYICSGEGECVMPLLIAEIKEKKIPSNPAVSYRYKNEIFTNKEQAIFEAFGTDFFDYQHYIKAAKGKILYYESSRGCPFDCAYCLSGAQGGSVRELPLERIIQDMQLFLKHDIDLVKFVDRTFNCNRKRARDIIEYLIQHTGDMRIHFEIGADLLDEKTLALLQRAPKGKFQLEAGIQSFNEETLNAILRKTDLPKLEHNLKRIMQMENTHLHIDLIAGLPKEDFLSFQASFNRAYALAPHKLQLGFLKILKGSTLEKQAQSYGIAYRSYPPYELLYSQQLSHQQLLVLKGIEVLLERYDNAWRCKTAVAYCIEHAFCSPFDFYNAFYQFSNDRNTISRPLGSASLYREIYAFAESVLTTAQLHDFSQHLTLDYIMSGARGERLSILKDVNNRQQLGAAIQALKAEGKIEQIHVNRGLFALIENEEKQKQLVMANPLKKHPLTGLLETHFFDLPSTYQPGAYDEAAKT